MKKQSTFQVGDITVHMLHGNAQPSADIVTYQTMAWDVRTEEMGRNLRTEVTTAFLADLDKVAIPLNWDEALENGNSLRTVANEIAGSVHLLAERRRVKHGAAPVANPFTLVFVSPERSENKNRSVLSKLRKLALDSQKAKRVAQNNNG